MFRNGIYKISYGLPSDDAGDAENAIAVVRAGRLIGSDRHGAVFTGEPMCCSGPLETLRIQLTMPPGGELVTGYKAGPLGSTLNLRGQFDPALNVQKALIEVAGEQIAVNVAYLGPVPE